jgi:hypothetical protein
MDLRIFKSVLSFWTSLFSFSRNLECSLLMSASSLVLSYTNSQKSAP